MPKWTLPLIGAQETPIPFDEWVQEAPNEAVAPLSRLLQAWADNETDNTGAAAVQVVGNGIELSPAFVASLTEADAKTLGFPPATRLTLQLVSRGGIQDPTFEIGHRWTRAGGIPMRVDVRGARLEAEGKVWRLAEPLYSTLAAAGRVNAAGTEHERQQELAALKLALGEEAAANVDPDGYIEQLRLSYAAAFSLDLQFADGGFDFDPVLFSPDRADAAAEDGEVIDASADSLLSPSQQRSFAAKFRSGAAARSTYLLNDGGFLFIDPALKRTLDVVHAKQHAPLEERRQFVRNPRRAIRAALGEGAAGEEASSAEILFIETQQFSERVSGIDQWRKPVLPWIKPRANSWLPEQFGVRIGDGEDATFVEIAPEQAAAAAEAVAAALARDEDTVDVGGTQIPATEQAHSALSSLAEVAEHAAEWKGAEAAPPPTLNRYFLQVRDNLEEIAYAPLAAGSRPVPEPPPPFPDLVRTDPKPHQKQGFDWLVANWRAGVPGVLLADDMGLGKTFQALAFLSWVRHAAAPDRPFLIVAPTGLLANWRAEIERHLEPAALGTIVDARGAGLRPFRSAGGRDIDTGAALLDTAAWIGANVVMTTYETLRDFHMSFARIPFAVIVYDEIQKLKNPASQVTRAAKTLNGRLQIAMTGTPVENRLQDLWSILDVVHPGSLGSSKAFEAKYPADNREQLRELHDLLTKEQGGRPATLLRRMKNDNLEGLPKKHICSLPRDMPVAQARAYTEVIHRAMVARGQRGRMLETLHQLRGVSLHPRAPDRAAWNDEAYSADSARLQAVFAKLDEIREKGEKVLIFCESLAMQAFMAVEIRRRYGLPHDVARIHGGVSGDARQRAVDVFQGRPDGFDVMILSPKAGGVGLTLTRANHVFHLSRWWNPAVEDQATDRVYRIGQTRDVFVYVPQALHPDPTIRPTSFDLKLDRLMCVKRALSRDLFVPPETESDISELFDDVTGSGEGATAPDEAASTAPAEGRAEPAPLLQADGVAKAAAEPIPVDSEATDNARPTAPRRVVFTPGQRRDFAIFEAHIAGEPLVRLLIRDRYTCANPMNRGHLIDFVKVIQDGSASIGSVTVRCWDAESTRPDGRESDSDQWRDLNRRWSQRVGRTPRLTLHQISKRQRRNFHDRAIEAETASGRKLVWDIGNGIDGLMDVRRECTVVCTPEP